MMSAEGTILALDVGTKRIGVALASCAALISSPYKTLLNSDKVWAELQAICTAEDVRQLVVGLPRGLDGQTTHQTDYAEEFAKELAAKVALPISLVDEAVTSRQAEAELIARGRNFEKGDIDALAAVYILDDYISEMDKA
jgi:putative Holliday junction resolvase